MADSKTDIRVDPNHTADLKALEKNILRKLDRRILPLIITIYFVCTLDKVNIGNAAIAGLITDLNLQDVQFNIALSVFFITYILFELPSNLVMKKFQSGRWLGFLAFSWGLVMTLMGLTQSYAGLVIARLMLGAFEGGITPGVIFYLSCIYKRHELQFRIAMVISAASSSGLFSGLLASGIVKLDGVRNLSGWRWIFILEGIATVLIGILIAILLPNDVGSAWFLSDEEKDYGTRRLDQDRSGTLEIEVTNSEVGEVFEWKEVKRGIFDIQTWLTGLAIFGVGSNLYSAVFFLPTIVSGLGYTGWHAQLYTAPPYLLAAFFIVTASILSDRLKLRGPMVLLFTPLTMIGYTMVVVGKNNMVRYAGCCFLAIGPYVSAPCILAVLVNNSSGHYKRATAAAMQVIFVALGGAVAPFLYTSDQAPMYIRGHLISLCFAILTWIFTAANILYCTWENKARNEGHRGGNIDKYKALRDAGLTKAPIGDRHPSFKLTL